MSERLPAGPHLSLDLEAFESNVAHLARTIIVEGGKRWRPHIKAIRSPALALRLIKAGASGVTCATVDEAQTMVEAGIDDVLIASQVVAPESLGQLALLNRRASVAVAVDSEAHVALLADAAAGAGVTVPVAVEMDVGLGRAGLSCADDVVALALTLGRHPQLRFCGLMAWEGQTTRIVDAAAKHDAVHAAVGLLTRAARACRDAGLAVEMVSCGGTGTYPISSSIAGVTEIQAGGGVFGDLRYRCEFGLPLTPALTLCATVLSRPNARRLVCDAGWKYHGYHPTRSKPLGMPEAYRMAHSAEHLTLDFEADVAGFEVGQPVALAVGYADSTVFLHRQMVLRRDGEITEVLPLPARR